jgi:ribosomal protein L37E
MNATQTTLNNLVQPRDFDSQRDLNDPQCRMCGDYLAFARWEIGKRTCLECGEEQARQERAYWCVAGINKSNPMLVTDIETLKQLNPKRVTV